MSRGFGRAALERMPFAKREIAQQFQHVDRVRSRGPVRVAVTLQDGGRPCGEGVVGVSFVFTNDRGLRQSVGMGVQVLGHVSGDPVSWTCGPDGRPEWQDGAAAAAGGGMRSGWCRLALVPAGTSEVEALGINGEDSEACETAVAVGPASVLIIPAVVSPILASLHDPWDKGKPAGSLEVFDKKRGRLADIVSTMEFYGSRAGL